MAVVQVKTFLDIYTSVIEAAKIQSGDTTSIDRIKRAINAAYINEIASAEEWDWLHDYVDISREPQETGTVSTTKNSTEITFGSAPASSKERFRISINGQAEVYQIESHVAGSTAATLTAPFTNATATGSSFTLWVDGTPMPSNTREITQVTHDLTPVPLTGVGVRELRRNYIVNPKREGRPIFHSLSDYIDPDPYQAIGSLPSVSTVASTGLVRTVVFGSSVASLITEGDVLEVSLAAEEEYNGHIVVSDITTTTMTYTGTRQFEDSANADAAITFKKERNETNSARYRELLVFPSNDKDRHTLHVDYIREVPPLDADTDEPLMPISDRIVLVYEGLAWAYRNLLRNPEEADKILAKSFRKLAKMQGKLTESTDTPRLMVNKSYLAGKRRRNRLRPDFKRFN